LPRRPVRSPNRQTPTRSCVACRTVRAQSALLRVSADAAGQLTVDARPPTGRSVYCCRVAACVERAFTPRALIRALRREDLDVTPAAIGRLVALAGRVSQ
jgi:uncharacterized protein